MNAIRDPWNPTIDEIRDWAHSSDLDEPCENWHYSLRIAQHIQLYIDLVADRSCERRMRFLDVLYDTVREWLMENPESAEIQVNLSDIASRARRTGCYYLMNFAEDVEAAKKAGSKYDLDFWSVDGYSSRLSE